LDVRKTETANMADEFVQLQQGSDYLVVSALRRLLSGHADVVPESVGGVSKEQLTKLVDMLKTAKFVGFSSGWVLRRANQGTRTSIMPSL